MNRTLLLILLLGISMKHPAFFVMILTFFIINEVYYAYNPDALNSPVSFFVNFIIIYYLFKLCLEKQIPPKVPIKPLSGIADFLNPFNKRTCSDGILCSFLAFGSHLLVYMLINLKNYLDFYGHNTPQGYISYCILIAVILIIIVFIRGFRMLKNK